MEGTAVWGFNVLIIFFSFNSSDTEAPFLDLNLSMTSGTFSSISYDKRCDFNFEIVKFPFLVGDASRFHLLWRIYFSAYSFCKSVF